MGRIVLLDRSLESAYTSFLDGREDGLFYYCLRYRDLLASITGGSAEYYVALDGQGSVRGILPLFRLDGAFGRVYNSLPFYGSHGGVLAADGASARALRDHYNSLVRHPSVAAATLIAHPFGVAADSEPAFDLLDGRTGQFTSLRNVSTPSDLMDRFHQKTRNMVRKGEKSGLLVQIENDAVDDLRSTHQQNMVALGGQPKPEAFFDGLLREFRAGDDFQIWVARLDGVPVAALLLLYFNKTVEYFTPAITAEYRDLQPMSLIIFRAMFDAAKRGFSWWNWGGTWSTQEGVYRFKKRWGTQDFPYRYFICVNDASLYDRSSAELLEAYPYFYVVPFARLSAQRAGAEMAS